MKSLGVISNEEFDLEVIECDCGFYIGFGSSFIEHVGSFEFECPSCNRIIDIKNFV